MGNLNQPLIFRGRSYNDSGRIQVIIQFLGFPQKIQAEQDISVPGLLPNMPHIAIAYRDRGFDHNERLRIAFRYQTDTVSTADVSKKFFWLS